MSLLAPTYIVKQSAAKMPSKCWGRYVRIGLLECDPGTTRAHVSRICEGGRVRRVVAVWEKCNVGRTPRCASERAWEAALDRAERMQRRADAEAAERQDAAVAESLAARSGEEL